MTADQHPWPEELREMLNDWLDDAYESTEPRPNADALLSAIAAAPFTVVRRDEYEALRSVEAMLDELVGHRMDVRFWMSAPGFQEMMVSGREQSIIRTIIDDGDWRAALRAAYEQVRRGDGGERG